ncbi:hypothetical protein HYV56_01190 [Candidatus Peregrinibacteria bacterium]|nr:hypothetical protein [Candidatus Peregrinibacteria bacterium]
MEKLYLVIAAITMVVGQITLKFGMEKVGEVDLIQNGLWQSFRVIFFNPIVIVGLFFYFASAFLYLVSISKLELSFAYPVTISISYISIPFLSWLIFKDRISFFHIFLLFVIFICLVLFYKSK